jgi:outer membrane lipoprotein-sorting protein
MSNLKSGLSYLIYLILFFPLMPTAAGAPPPGQTPEAMGRSIFVTQDEMDRGYQDARVEMSMILINAAGEESQRQMFYHSLEVMEDGDKTLIVFQHPRDIKGTGLLTFEHIQREDDQWLYLPALKRVKRIASKNKSGSFVGSEFAYEDISSNEPDKYDYRYLREDKYDNLDVWIVERYPKDPNSGYTRIISWVDQSNHQTVKEEFFDRKDAPLKIQFNNENTRYLDKYWRPTEIVMENLQTKKRSILRFQNWRFRQGLTDSFFTKRSLERQR